MLKFLALGSIVAIWLFGFHIFGGLNMVSVIFGIVGTLCVGAGLNGFNQAKANKYLASKYDESKKR